MAEILSSCAGRSSLVEWYSVSIHEPNLVTSPYDHGFCNSNKSPYEPNCFYRELFIYHSGSRKQKFLRDTLKQYFTENQHRQVHCHLISTRLSTRALARVRILEDSSIFLNQNCGEKKPMILLKPKTEQEASEKVTKKENNHTKTQRKGEET